MKSHTFSASDTDDLQIKMQAFLDSHPRAVDLQVSLEEYGGGLVVNIIYQE